MLSICFGDSQWSAEKIVGENDLTSLNITFSCWIHNKKHQNIFAFSIIFQYWDDVGSWNPSLWGTSVWVGGLILKWWSPSWLDPTTTRDVWIITSFQIGGYVLHVEHISCVIMNCHPLSFFNSSLSLTGGKHYQKINLSRSLDLSSKILLIQVAFFIFCAMLSISHNYLLTHGRQWSVYHVCSLTWLLMT